MSRYSDCQFDLVSAIIEDVAEDYGFDDRKRERLTRLVFASDELWDEDKWSPLLDFVGDVAQDMTDR